MNEEMIANKIAAAMQKARDEIGATEQQKIAFGYAEAAMRETLTRIPAEPRPADGEMVEKVARALCQSHKLNPDAKIACLNPEHHHKPQWVTFKAHAQAAIAAYNPNERLREALEPFARFADLFPDGWLEQCQVTHHDADGDRDLLLSDFRRARSALSPLPQGEE